MKLYSVIISAYYLLLVTSLSFLVVDTVFQGSVLIGRGTKTTQTQHHKEELLRTKADLNQNIDRATALSAVQDQLDLEQFVAIKNPIVVTARTEVASR